ncbi:TerB family tellurite resistance protein [uncultured Microscilla sp.]|uniref:TerB family tellurite resistance protein n=1 Tax=uncultured Microscilla sp. TaxID=432653 RepID=UPI0026074877|nr:TerB family tellurite resistance protein [uncultured Microscilla sp.]
MVNKEQLYDAFGELIYAVAKADGLIQAEEQRMLENILTAHPWASQIRWSFDYESKKGMNPEDSYKKALDIFKEHGPDPDYVYLLDVLKKVAEASDGIDANEQKVIDSFQSDLYKRFVKDAEENNWM